MIKRQIVRACEGVDISPQSVAACKEAAKANALTTLTYRVGDVEKLALPRDTYDLVVGWMALHHLADPGRVFARVSRALRPNGVFVVNEYIGPPRFQMPDLQAKLIDEWVRKLPEELRRTSTGVIGQGFTPPTVAQVIARDSSEAIASDRILPELERHFVIVERVDYGGMLLQWILEDTAQNYDRHNSEHQAWLGRLYDAERDILRRGLLRSDFTFIIARPGGD
jgi:SAM-dependent methyltransferase